MGPAAGHTSCSLGRGWHAEPHDFGPFGKQFLWHVSPFFAAAGQSCLCSSAESSAKNLFLHRIPEQWGTEQGMPKLSTLLLHGNILAGSLPIGWDNRSGPYTSRCKLWLTLHSNTTIMDPDTCWGSSYCQSTHLCAPERRGWQ